MSYATSSTGCAMRLRLATRPSRSRAAIRAARFITARASTTTRTSTRSLFLRGQSLLALQDPPRHRDSGGVRRVHSPVAQAPRSERARLRVRRVGCVMDDAEVEVRLGHVHALVDGVAVGLADLVR